MKTSFFIGLSLYPCPSTATRLSFALEFVTHPSFTSTPTTSLTSDSAARSLESLEYIELAPSLPPVTVKGATSLVNNMGDEGVDLVTEVWDYSVNLERDEGLATAVVKSSFKVGADVDGIMGFWGGLEGGERGVKTATTLVRGLCDCGVPEDVVENVVASVEEVDCVLIDVLCNSAGYENVALEVLERCRGLYVKERGGGGWEGKVKGVRRRKRNRDFMRRRGWNEVNSGWKWWGGGEWNRDGTDGRREGTGRDRNVSRDFITKNISVRRFDRRRRGGRGD